MKVKKVKRSNVDKVGLKKPAKKMNPFEVRVNRKKHNVLGQRSKTDKGMPGIARSKAIKKRKGTLLQEYKLKGKVNHFVDRRIGEKDQTMTADDKILARYTTERMRFHSKKNLFNLDDNEVLTHRGESLADIEKFEDPKSDDEFDEDGRNPSGKLGEDFVSEAHFGGGLLKKIEGDRNRKDLIDQMIAESKRKKVEQQKLREQTLDLTEKLDSEWKDISVLVQASKPKDDIPTLPSDKRFASYDKLSKELKFEARGKATDKLKDEKEIAKEERENLERLERERLARMNKDSSSVSKPKHRSADDLDNDFDYNNDATHRSDSNEDFNPKTADTGLGLVKDESDDSSDEKDDESENEEDEDDESEDDLSDLKESDSEGEEEDEQKNELSVKPQKSASPNRSLRDLPFTLSVPETYDEFSKMCFNREPEYQAVVVERMVKSNHPSLPDGSRQKLINLYKYCLQHLQDTASDRSSRKNIFIVLDRLSPWLYDLAHFAPAAAGSILCDVIKEKYADFLRSPRRFPGLDTLIFFKLVSVLFPTSDFRHRIVTPTLTFMQHILSSCQVQSSVDVSIGLFVTTLLFEFTALSKRIVPEAINFLRGILRTAQGEGCTVPLIPPFKSNSFSLHVDVSSRYNEGKLLPMGTSDLITASSSDLFKVRAVSFALSLLEGFITRFNGSEEYLLVAPLISLLVKEHYSPCLHSKLSHLNNLITKLKDKKFYRLQAMQKRPMALRLYEPKIEEVYSLKRKKNLSKDKEEHDKLLQRYKKEVKGALREIRRDNAFLSKLKFYETKSSDLERKRKVKEIMGDAAQQMGELRKIKRAK